MWTLAHRKLQEACIYLFPEPRDCRLLLANSGMDISQINFDEPPALRWQSAINEAEKQNTLHKLVPVLLARYPQNPQLKAACAPWEAAEPVSTVPTKETPVPPEATRPRSGTEGLPKGRLPHPDGELLPDLEDEDPAETTITTQTPTTVTTTTQRKRSDVKLVALEVPAELADAVYEDAVATISSLRMTVSALDKRVNDLEAWRIRISRISSAKIAQLRADEAAEDDAN